MVSVILLLSLPKIFIFRNGRKSGQQKCRFFFSKDATRSIATQVGFKNMQFFSKEKWQDPPSYILGVAPSSNSGAWRLVGIPY